jgi:transcriptional regulator with XRE-family HTH domain
MVTPLRELRESTGLSAYAFAKEVGITPQYYHNLEQGHTDMRGSTLVKLARGLAGRLKRKPSDVLAELTKADEKETVAI